MERTCEHAWEPSRRGMGEYDCRRCGAFGHRFWWSRGEGVRPGWAYATNYDEAERVEAAAGSRNAEDRAAWERARVGDDAAPAAS